jgi:type I restriction enzyme S subunit
MKRIPLAIPPLQEQTKIAQFLDDKTTKIDEAIAIKEQQIQLLKERKQILIHKAVTQGLNPNVTLKDSGVKWIGEIPEGWEVYKFTHLTKLIVDGTHFSPKSYDTGEFKYITAKNIKENDFDFSNISYVTSKDHYSIFPRCPVQKGDILYIKDGATAGIAMINTLEEEFSLLSSVALIRPIEIIVNNLFLKHYLNSQVIRNYISTQIVGGAITRLTLELINKFKIIVPPLSEQKEISEYIETASQKIETAINLKQQEIEKLKEYKSSLINGVVTGKVKVI